MAEITTGTPAKITHVTIVDGKPTTTTHDIADVYGKRHDSVLKIVRKRMTEVPAEWCLHNFVEASIEVPQPNGGTATYPVIRMTKKGFHFVVGKFTGIKAVQHQIAFADEFERMETELNAVKPVSDPPLALPPPPVGLTEEQCESAVQAGALASFQVQMALARAVLKGGEQWKHQRWLIYFTTDSTMGAPPVVERVGADLRTVAQLCEAVERGELSSMELLELTAASAKALATGMRAEKQR